MLHFLFPIPIYVATNSTPLESCKLLFSKCNTLDEESTPGFRTTLKNYNHRETTVSWKIEDNKESEPLIHFIAYSVQQYAEACYLKPHKIFIDAMWMNTMEPMSMCAPHGHFGHTYSGVYYVDVPEGSGKLMFNHPLTQELKADLKTEHTIKETAFNTDLWWIPVEEGTIVIFPSYLRHSVPQMNFKGIRKTIAFDVSLVPIDS
jgi:uncharacterized protein (TIGR02466 family)